MITRLTGKLEILSLEEAYITIGPVQIAALISEETRLRLQGQVGEARREGSGLHGDVSHALEL